MTDQLPGRTPPWAMGVWAYPTRLPAQPDRTPTEPVRIGDAERDEALNRLGDHFAAGRLTREEFDERSETAMGARFDRDLEALFRDLPKAEPSTTTVVRRERPKAAAVLSSTVVLLVPLLVLAVVASIALHGPIFFGPIIWLLVLGHLGRRQRHP